MALTHNFPNHHSFVSAVNITVTYSMYEFMGITLQDNLWVFFGFFKDV